MWRLAAVVTLLILTGSLGTRASARLRKTSRDASLKPESCSSDAASSGSHR